MVSGKISKIKKRNIDWKNKFSKIKAQDLKQNTSRIVWINCNPIFCKYEKKIGFTILSNS